MKKTVVEWYFTQLWRAPKDKFMWHRILIKAKEMEKRQAVNDYNAGHDNGTIGKDITGEQYYKETFNTK